jgi:hypothetical protein
MMSDSTNVLTPGRTPGEAIVKDSLMQKVMDYQGKGRVVVTQVGKTFEGSYETKMLGLVSVTHVLVNLVSKVQCHICVALASVREALSFEFSVVCGSEGLMAVACRADKGCLCALTCFTQVKAHGPKLVGPGTGHLLG